MTPLESNILTYYLHIKYSEYESKRSDLLFLVITAYHGFILFIIVQSSKKVHRRILFVSFNDEKTYFSF